MSIHKFTTDGRKVVIVGTLNSQETIVQEVFVSVNGAEIPSGENFVVKSLHDEPVKSWKIKSIEDEERDVSRRQADVNRLKEAIKHENKRLDAVLSALRKYKSEDQFYPAWDNLALFMTGGITHLVELGWSPSIVEFNKSVAPGEYDGGSIKLLSLFGGSDGNVEWRLHSYSDHSGGSKAIVPATSYDHAVSILSKSINAKDSINSYDVKASEQHGFKIAQDKLDAFTKSEIKQKEKFVAEKKQQLQAALKELESLKSK